MSWSERQRLMLGEMGLRLWSAPAAPAVPAVAQAAAQAVAQAAAPATAPATAPRSSVTRPERTAATVASAAAVGPPPAPTPVVLTGAVAEMGWPALREAVAACRACGLCESRTQTVFGVGHESAHWLLLGEAPGEQEDLQGEPFVGAAGQLLDRMLAALKLTRQADGDAPVAQRVYIANTLKCRPPRNRNPTPQEMAQCEPFLMRQIELQKPRIILAMGRFAVQALLRSDEPIGRLRGRLHHYQGVPLVVTYHPAYLLRSPLDKAKAWEDLCFAAQLAEASTSTAASGPVSA
jgi:uracil-DNA glycosylase